MYSKYLGLLSIQPNTTFVGCFTYAIPMKFTKRWARMTGAKGTFLPELNVDKMPTLCNFKYSEDKIYGIQIANPLKPDTFSKYILEIHKNNNLGIKSIDE